MKLIVTSSPHIRGDFRTSRLMLDVVLALIPALIVGTVVLGFRALLVTLISMVAAVVGDTNLLRVICCIISPEILSAMPVIKILKSLGIRLNAITKTSVSPP